MELVTSGDVKKAAREENVPEDHLEEFIKCFHRKTQYLNPEQAFKACLDLERAENFEGHPGQIRQHHGNA